MNYGPRIVKSGLVLALDAGDRNSYASTGAAWTDLSGNKNTGTLVNSPVFNNISQGGIFFNGSTQYASISNSTSLQVADSFTLCAWVYATSLATRYSIFSTRVNNPAGSWQLEIGSTGAGSLSTNRIAFTGVGSWIAETFDNVITTNAWYHICLTKVNNATTGGTFYINGKAVANRQINAYTISNNADVKRIATSNGTSELFPGYISETLLYNRPLSAMEILQNYNATSARFILNAPPSIVSSGLVLNLDATNASSYSGTGTTWTDLSGNSNNGTLVNTPTYSAVPAGNIVFNGTNQYINMGLSTYCNVTNISVSAWVFVPTAATGTAYIVGRYFNTTNNNGFYLYYNNSTSKFGVDGRETSAAYLSLVTTNTYSKGVWYNFAWTKSGSTWSLYINGVLDVSSTVGAGATAFSNNNMWLAASNIGSSQFYGNLRLGGVNIYNRTLTLNEVSQNYNVNKLKFGLQ